MSLRWRVTLGAILGIVLITLASAVTYARYTQTVSSGQEISQALQPASEQANTVTSNISELDRTLQVYVLEPTPAALTGFNALYADTNSLLQTLQALNAPELEQARIDAATVQANLNNWHTQVATPVIKEVQAGNTSGGQAKLDDPSSLEMFNTVDSSGNELFSSLNEQRKEAFDATNEMVKQLGRALMFSALLAIAGLGLAILLALRWFLRPLDQLRHQLRHVARRGHHNDPITPNGPPEIAAAGADAELMRRQLVLHGDEAKAATEGLAQEGPIVTGIRELLAPAHPELTTPNLEIAGSTHAAEGVMSGDWWDSFHLSDGRILTVLTDIAGHGSDTTLTALNSKITVSDAIKDTSDLSQIASLLSECFGDTSFEATQGDDREIKFATSALLAFNPTTHELEWINAGHPAPIVVDQSGVVAKLEQTGPMMSALGGKWPSNRITLAAGQSVIAWSDGISESRNHDGQFLDDDGVASVVNQLNQQRAKSVRDRTRLARDRATSARDLVPLVLSNIRQQASSWDHDDTTLVIMQVH